MYFGGTIMTFALPYGAFIAAAIALFYLFRARHSGPRLRWSVGSAAEVTSVSTREPGPGPAPEATVAAPASAAAPAPASEPTAPAPPAPAAAETKADDGPAGDETEGKDGEPG
jgi:nucleoid-associated protein YgaU